jgi:formyl-CoA transferase
VAPTIGENTDEILRSIGLTDAQLASLKERGIAFTK